MKKSFLKKNGLKTLKTLNRKRKNGIEAEASENSLRPMRRMDP
jgi:hypothetical protein